MAADQRIRLFAIGLSLALFPYTGGLAQKRTDVPTPAASSHHGHSATLRWVASPDAANHKGAKYWVYRTEGTRGPGGNPKCGSDFKRISVVEASATSYIDKKVKPNKVYCYYIITVTGKTNKDRSKPTDTVVAVIPEHSKH